MSERTVPSPPAATPLLTWLLVALAPMKRTGVKQLLTGGRVHVNGVSVTRHDHPATPTDRLTIGPPTTPDPLAGVPVVYRDDALIVLDKPPGLLTVATADERVDTAFARLAAHLGDAGRPYVVHRLDRDTSGLLLFALTAEARDQLQATWADVDKRYWAVVRGCPPAESGTVVNYLLERRDLRVAAFREPVPGAKRAETAYRVATQRGRYALIDCHLVTGRKHQIRVHLAGLSCPVIGDLLYGGGHNPADRLGLHATRLSFPHPTTGERIALESPLPRALRAVVSAPGGPRQP